MQLSCVCQAEDVRPGKALCTVVQWPTYSRA